MISRFLIRMTWLLAACVCQFALMFFLAPVLQQKYFNSIVGPLVMGALFGIAEGVFRRSLSVLVNATVLCAVAGLAGYWFSYVAWVRWGFEWFIFKDAFGMMVMWIGAIYGLFAGSVTRSVSASLLAGLGGLSGGFLAYVFWILVARPMHSPAGGFVGLLVAYLLIGGCTASVISQVRVRNEAAS